MVTLSLFVFALYLHWLTLQYEPDGHTWILCSVTEYNFVLTSVCNCLAKKKRIKNGAINSKMVVAVILCV